MNQSATPHTKRAIERELEVCESVRHLNPDYWDGAIDVLMWIQGRTPPPSSELPDEQEQ